MSLSSSQSEGPLAAGQVAVAEDDGPRRRSRLYRFVADTRVRQIATQILLLVGVLVFWELASDVLIDRFLISSPSAIGAQLWRWIFDGTILRHAETTLVTAVIGFLIGGSIAILVGYGLAVSDFWARVFDPFITALWSLPRVAIIPLLIVWVGTGAQLATTVSATIVFFSLFYNTFYGVRDVNKNLINMIRVMGGSAWDVAIRVRIPSAFSWIVAGMKLSVPQAFVGVVVAEMLASNRGLGYLVQFNANQFNTAGTFAALVVLIAVGFAIDRSVTYATNHMLRWQG